MKPVLAMVLLAAAAGAHAEATPNYQEDTLTGDWGGERTELYQRGVQWDFGYKADFLRNASGGIEKGSRYMGLVDAKLKLDLEKLLDWGGATAYFNVQSASGGRLNANKTGSFMGVDNQEVPVNTTRLFHAWVQKNFLDDKLSVLAGLYPIDSEFYVTDASGVFLHPSYGMSAEIAGAAIGGETGGTFARGPSIFNSSAFGVRLAIQPDPRYYAQLAVVDGAPGHPSNPRGTHMQFNRGEGAMVITELGWRPFEKGHVLDVPEPEKGVPKTAERALEEQVERLGKFAVGFWRYNPKFDDLVDVDAGGNPEHRRAQGAYVLGEMTVYQEEIASPQGLAVFFRHGVTDGNTSPLKSSTSLGLRYVGLISGRDEDVLGFAVTRARMAEKFNQSSGGGLDSHEQVVELTYRAQITPWLAIQPDVQRISNPGFDPALKNATVVGARVEVTF